MPRTSASRPVRSSCRLDMATAECAGWALRRENVVDPLQAITLPGTLQLTTRPHLDRNQPLKPEIVRRSPYQIWAQVRQRYFRTAQIEPCGSWTSHDAACKI